MFIFNVSHERHCIYIHYIHEIPKNRCTRFNIVPLTVLEEDVEQDDADLVVRGDVSVQQDGDDGPHGVLDLLPLGVGAHGQVLQPRDTWSSYNSFTLVIPNASDTL